MPSPADRYTIAQSWEGTPFQHQGRLKQVGVDCIGLIIEVYREYGWLAALGFPSGWNYTGYGRHEAGNILEPFLQQHLRKVTVCEAGCVGIFPFDDGSPTHSALLFPMGGEIVMVHAYNSPGRQRFRVQGHALRGPWRKRLWAMYAVPEGIA